MPMKVQPMRGWSVSLRYGKGFRVTDAGPTKEPGCGMELGACKRKSEREYNGGFAVGPQGAQARAFVAREICTSTVRETDAAASSHRNSAPHDRATLRFDGSFALSRERS